MKSKIPFGRLAAAIIVAAVVGACASSGALDHAPGSVVGQSANGAQATAVGQAVNGAIVGCATNPASNDDARTRQPHASPFCSRKG